MMVISDVTDGSFDMRIERFRTFVWGLQVCNPDLKSEIYLRPGDNGMNFHGVPIHDCQGFLCGYKSRDGREFYYS